MYLNDFQTDNLQFLSEAAKLQPEEELIFIPAGKEYESYSLKCIVLFSKTYLQLTKAGNTELLGLYMRDNTHLLDKLSEGIAELGIMRLKYRKVGAEK